MYSANKEMGSTDESYSHTGYEFAVRCAVVTATHHSANKAKRVDAETQTVERFQQRTVEQIVHCPMQQVVIPQEHISERITELIVVAPTPLAVYGAAPAPVIE